MPVLLPRCYVGVDFTHGICPECMESYFPGFAKEMEARSEKPDKRLQGTVERRHRAKRRNTLCYCAPRARPFPLPVGGGINHGISGVMKAASPLPAKILRPANQKGLKALPGDAMLSYVVSATITSVAPNHRLQRTALRAAAEPEC